MAVLRFSCLTAASAKAERHTECSHGCDYPSARTSARVRPPTAAVCGSKRGTFAISKRCSPRLSAIAPLPRHSRRGAIDIRCAAHASNCSTLKLVHVLGSEEERDRMLRRVLVLAAYGPLAS